MEIFDNEVIAGRRLKKLNPITGASVSLSSDVLYFAHIAVGAISEWQPLVIRNSGSVQVGITAYSTNGDYECEGDPISLAPGISTVIQVRFIPTADGLRLGDIHISTDISEGDMVVKLVGVGGEAFTVHDYNLLVARLGEAEGRIFDEETVRVTADTAFAHVLSLIGAKTADGSAFIINDSTVFVSPDESLGVRLNSINTELAGNTAAITAESSARSTEHTAQATVIQDITVKVGQNTAAIEAESSARASGDAASAELISTLSARVDDTEASISTEQTARVDGDQAIAEVISLLGSKTSDFSAFILNQTTTMVSPTMSLAQKFEELTATAHDDAGALIEAAVSDEATARADADGALSSRTTALETTVSDPNSGLAKAHARVTTEATARSEADSALATRTSNLETNYSDPATGNAALQARIAFEENTRSTAVAAVATRTSSLEASVNDATTGLVNAHARITSEQTVRATAVGTLMARASLLLDVNGRVTGWETQNSGTTSSFDIIVDKFRVVAPGYAPLAIFTVTSAGVQINGNLLVSGSVFAGQLGDGSMGTFGGNQQYTTITLPSNSVGVWRDIISQVITPQYGRPIFGMANISQRASGGKNGAEQRVRVIRDDGVVVWGVNGGAPNTSTKDGTTSTFTFFDNNPTQGVARTYKLQIALLWADDAVTVADRVLWVEEMSRTASQGIVVQGSPAGGSTAGTAAGTGGLGALAGKDTVTYGTGDVSGFGSLAAKTFVDMATAEIINKTANNLTYSGGATVDSLKPAQAGADVTLSHTAADYVGRGALANKNVADWTTDVVNVPSAQIFSRNLIDTSSWKGGNTLPASPGLLAGTVGNPGSVPGPIANEAGPFGKVVPVMSFTSNASGYGYGFGISAFPASGIDPKRSYRFRTWLWRTAGVGIFVNPGIGGTTPINIRRPGVSGYWSNAQDGGYIPPNNTWVLFVGIIHGSDYTGANTGQTGFYDTTGRKIGGSSLDGDFKFGAGAITSVGATVFCYDNGISGIVFKYADPVIEDMASAPPISALMATYGAVAGTTLFGTDGVTPLTQSDVKTAEGVAADYSGRGALANKNTVTYGTSDVSGFGALAAKSAVDLATTDIINKTATYIAPVTGRQWASESGADVTGGHVAADYTGRGVLANLNAVDLAGSTVINKSLANVDPTANTKLAGISTGASANLRLTLIGTVQPTVIGNAIRSTSGLYASIVRSDALPGPCYAEMDIVAGDHCVIQMDTEAADNVYNQQQMHASYHQGNGQFGIYRNGTPILDSVTTIGLVGKLRIAHDGYRYRMWIAGTEYGAGNAALVAAVAGPHYAKWTCYGANILYTGLEVGTFTTGAATSLFYSSGSSVAAKEPSQSGADVTLASQLVVRPTTDIQINFTSGGTVAANQLPLTIAAPLVTKGGVSITGSDNLLTYALSSVSAALGTVTVDNTSGSASKGQVTLANTPTALTGAGSYTLTVSYNGTVISIMRVNVTIVQATQAQGSSTGGSTGTIGESVGAAYMQVGQTVSGITVSGGKSIRCSYGGNYQVGGFNHSARGSVKFRYAPTGTTSYTDIGTPAQGSISSRGSQQTFDENWGSVNYSQNATPAAGTYDVSMWATSDSWNITFDGANAGSVTVS